MMRRQAPSVNRSGAASRPAARFCASIRCVRVEALRLGCPLRQGERLPGPAQRLADRLGPGVERLADLPPQRLADSGGQAGVVERGQRLVDLCTRGGERADSRQGRSAGTTWSRSAEPGAATPQGSGRRGSRRGNRRSNGGQSAYPNRVLPPGPVRE